MAPECLVGRAAESAPSIDVWAVGIMYYALLYGTLPFIADDEDTTIKLIKNAPLKWQKDIPITQETRDIISKMLIRDPEQRLQLIDFMDMEFYKRDDETFAEIVQKYHDDLKNSKEEQKTEVTQSSAYKTNALSPRGAIGSKGAVPVKGGAKASSFHKEVAVTPGNKISGAAAKPKKTQITKQ